MPSSPPPPGRAGDGVCGETAGGSSAARRAPKSHKDGTKPPKVGHLGAELPWCCHWDPVTLPDCSMPTQQEHSAHSRQALPHRLGLVIPVII